MNTSSIGVKKGRHGIAGGQLKFLNNDQIRRIDHAAKEILWRTGVKLPHRDALEILDDSGAIVDHKKERAWIPPYLVDEAIRKTPKHFTYAGRDPKKAIRLDAETVYFVMGIGPYVVEPDGTPRKATLKDMQDCYRVLDACDNVDVTGFGGGRGGPTSPEEEIALPLAVRRVRRYLRMLDLTEKPLDITGTEVPDREEQEADAGRAALDLINFEAACRGGPDELRKLPMSFAMNEAASPLMYLPRNIETSMVFARHGLPIYVGSGPMTNATGPATLAGTLALWLAETMCPLVLGAMAAIPEHRPPALWMTFGGHFDQLALTGPEQSSPEGALTQAACAQIAHYYGFPIRGIISTQSKLPDAQAGYETAVALLVSAMAGVNYNTSIGVIGPGEIGMSLEKIVLDDELVGYVKRVMGGITVTDETLAVEVIDEVGPGGSFLAHPHTRKWFRQEQYFPRVFDRRKYEDWVRRGRKDAVQRARERVQEILRDYWPEPLPPEVRKRIMDYVRSVEDRESRKVHNRADGSP